MKTQTTVKEAIPWLQKPLSDLSSIYCIQGTLGEHALVNKVYAIKGDMIAYHSGVGHRLGQ